MPLVLGQCHQAALGQLAKRPATQTRRRQKARLLDGYSLMVRFKMLNGPIARATIRTSFVLGLRLLVQAGTLLLVARMLGPADYGAFAAIAAALFGMATLWYGHTFYHDGRFTNMSALLYTGSRDDFLDGVDLGADHGVDV